LVLIPTSLENIDLPRFRVLRPGALAAFVLKLSSRATLFVRRPWSTLLAYVGSAIDGPLCTYQLFPLLCCCLVINNRVELNARRVLIGARGM
jgi:hypothetical protein